MAIDSQETEPMNFETGDVVHLKSGGPNMTVREVVNGECACDWSPDYKTIKKGKWPVAMLERTPTIEEQLAAMDATIPSCPDGEDHP